MADLRIVDAPLLSTVKGTEKLPTGGEGNFSVSVNQVADFAKLKWVLATEGYVDNAVGNVQADLNLHKNNTSNPHDVTKVQVGLGNVDNTADADKPVSNSTQAAIITANSGKADKSYVDSQDQLKADKNTVESSLLLKADKVDLKASKITSDSNQTQQEINDFGGAKWWNKSGGYKLGATVILENGDIVKSTVNGNTNDPNVDMTGWVSPKLEQEKKNSEAISTSDYGSIGDGTLHTIREWFDSGKYASLNAIQIKYPHATSLDNSIDWVASQKAINSQPKHGSIKVIGCLFLQQGEKLITKAGQKIYGLSNNWFINTNNGTQFTGSLTGDLPEYGIYYDGTTGCGLKLAEAATLENIVVFGKGYTVTDGSVNILLPAFAAFHDTVGVEIDKFAIFNNCSIFYFKKAMRSLAGNFYSRYTNVEITRCEIAHEYADVCYSQHYYGCTMREVRKPFLFNGKCVKLNYFGGSIEGFLSTTGTGAIEVLGRSDLSFYGTYFESFETSIVSDALFKFTGGLSTIHLYSCINYLNNISKFIDTTGRNDNQVISKGCRLLVSAATSVKAPIYVNIAPNAPTNSYDLSGDVVEYDPQYPHFTTTGSITVGTKTLTVTDATNVAVGCRVLVGTNDSIVTAVSGTTITVDLNAIATVAAGEVKIWNTPQYVQRSLGNGLENVAVKWPKNYIPSFDGEFQTESIKVIKSITAAPKRIFNGVFRSSTQLIADGTTWNPSGRSDFALGAYPVVYRGGRYFPMLGSFAGSFTATSGSATTVANTNVASSSKVVPIPTNSAAATLFKNGWYISAKNNAENFIITFQTSALGTETFDYTITD